VPPEVDKLVRHVSPATLGRLLAPARATRPPRGLSTTRLGTWLRHVIPIRTFTTGTTPGRGICSSISSPTGSSTRGFYLCTLRAVDIATAWVELEAVWGSFVETSTASLTALGAGGPGASPPPSGTACPNTAVQIAADR
jgi:hypothetical protein